MATLQTVNNIELRFIEDNEYKTNQRKLRGNRGFIVSAAVKYLLLKTKHSLVIRDCSLPNETNESKCGLRNKSL